MPLGLLGRPRLLAALLLGLAPLGAAVPVSAMLLRLPTLPFAALLLHLAVAAWWLASGWWAVLACSVLIDVLREPPSTIRRAGAARRLLLAVCGASLAAGALTPAHAGEVRSPASLPSPERPVGLAARGAGHTAARGAPQAPEAHLVRPGESLWLIAAARLPRAGPARIARLTDRIYRANRGVIGDDPDLLLPGTRLRLPPTDEPHPTPSKESR